MKKVIRAFRIAFLAMAIAALLISLTLGTPYMRRILPPGSGLEPYIAWYLSVTAISINLVWGYYPSLLYGVGAISHVNKAMVFSRVVQIILTVVLLVKGYGIVGTSAAYLFHSVLYRLLCKRYFYRLKGIRAGLSAISIVPFSEIKKVFSIIWPNTMKAGLVSLSHYLAAQALTIICSLFMSLDETAVFSLGAQIALAVSQVSSSVSLAYQPVLQSAYVSKDTIKMQRAMSLIVFAFIMVNLFGLTAVTFVGLPLLRLIRPETIVSAPIMLAIGAYEFIHKFGNCYTVYFSCTNRLLYVRAYVVTSVICVTISILVLGVFRLGIWGIILTQIGCQVIFNAWYWPLKAHRELSLPFKVIFRLGFVEIKKALRSS